jgi:hypothetical protein
MDGARKKILRIVRRNYDRDCVYAGLPSRKPPRGLSASSCLETMPDCKSCKQFDE